MEVILKKTKITNSILKQTLRSTESDLKRGEVLGWCLYNNMSYIVIYRSDIKTLTKYPRFKEITSPLNVNNEFLVEIRLGGNYVPIKYIYTNLQEAENFINTMERVKHFSDIKGQFFI